MQNFKDTTEMKEQYKTDKNLNSRVMLHQLYSTNKFGWSKWIFQNYQIKSGQYILELGCGNAGMWSSNSDIILPDIRLVLSDFSEGMIEASKINTKDAKYVIDYAVIDAQSIPYDDDMFDIVIANHMLYHVPDIDKALTEIARVLKPDGTFYATTLGNSNFKELIDILYDYDPQIDFAMELITEAFGLETGEALLSRYFKSVEMLRYEDSLHITEPQPLIDYLLSSQGIGNINDIIVDDKIADFAKYIEGLFAEKGYIDIQKDAGMFICK